MRRDPQRYLFSARGSFLTTVAVAVEHFRRVIKMGCSGSRSGVSSPMARSAARRTTSHMTTITAEAVPAGRTHQIWKSVATFVAGAVLAGGIVTGVSMARDDSSSSVHGPAKTVNVSTPSSDDPGCPSLQRRGLC